MARKNAQDNIAFCTHVSNQIAGQKVLDFLSQRFRYFDRQMWSERIQAKDVYLNEKLAQADLVLQTGDILKYVATSRPEPKVPLQIPIVFEDEDLLIVNKPQHIPVHPGGRYLRNSLIHQLQTQKKLTQLFLCHRLDRETSGLCVLAKSQRAKESLYWQFFNHQVEKVYHALVWGIPPNPYGTINAPIGDSTPQNSKIRIKKLINGTKAKQAKTKFVTVKTKYLALENSTPPPWPHLRKGPTDKWPITLLECRPVTGRTNQIRVHLAHLGCGIVGDKLYDPDENTFLSFKNRDPLLDTDKVKRPGNFLNLSQELMNRLILDGHALHAAQLTIKHPKNNKKMTFKAPFPKNWKGLY